MRGDPYCAAERGSVTVLTVMVLALAAILTLVTVDLLRALESKARAQTAADAAALAAAQEMARPSSAPPFAFAAEYARRNGATLIACRCDGPADAVVTVSVPVDLLFVGGDREVSARARAVVATSAGTA